MEVPAIVMFGKLDLLGLDMVSKGASVANISMNSVCLKPTCCHEVSITVGCQAKPVLYESQDHL